MSFSRGLEHPQSLINSSRSGEVNKDKWTRGEQLCIYLLRVISGSYATRQLGSSLGPMSPPRRENENENEFENDRSEERERSGNWRSQKLEEYEISSTNQTSHERKKHTLPNTTVLRARYVPVKKFRNSDFDSYPHPHHHLLQLTRPDVVYIRLLLLLSGLLRGGLLKLEIEFSR